VTVLTKQRVRHFENASIVECCAAQILRACAKEKFEVCVSCYMPDHWHALARGITTDCDFLRFIKLAKQLSAYHVKREFRIELWAGGFYDRIVREDEDVMRYVRYIWNNPAVAGLVSDPSGYPHLYLAPEFRQLLDETRGLKAAPTGREGDLLVTRDLKVAPTGRPGSPSRPVSPTFRSGVIEEPDGR